MGGAFESHSFPTPMNEVVVSRYAPNLSAIFMLCNQPFLVKSHKVPRKPAHGVASNRFYLSESAARKLAEQIVLVAMS
jgi:hypothetical protein